MTTLDHDSHELADIDGGAIWWPEPGCNPFPWPPFPGPIWDMGSTDCFPGPIVY